MLRLSELYTSVQCEGPNTGRMVQFVRFAGCNMRCPLWPCDTQHAIDPKIYRTQSEMLTPTQLYDMVDGAGPWDLCLTGGEPFLQPKGDLQEFVQLAREGKRKIEVFTNGSFEFPAWAMTGMQFIMDWKLEGSGEAATSRFTRSLNAGKLMSKDSIKFVCVNEDDLDEAVFVWKNLMEEGCDAQFWAGAAWGKMEPQQVIDYIQENKLPWKLNVQVHKYIWEPDERGV